MSKAMVLQVQQGPFVAKRSIFSCENLDFAARANKNGIFALPLDSAFYPTLSSVQFKCFEHFQNSYWWVRISQ